MTKAYEQIAEGLEDARNMIREFAPGSFGCHEALHMASFLANAVDRELCEHNAIKLVPKWHKKATRAAALLTSLYQDIGAAHVRNEPPALRRHTRRKAA